MALKSLPFELDRSAKMPLSEQIRRGITAAIDNGVLAPGARLPSWLDLAAQLGVARGTVRSAYEKLIDAQLIVSSRASGTYVAERPSIVALPEVPDAVGWVLEMYRDAAAGPAIFQMGIPASDRFPAKLFSRIRAQAVRTETSKPAHYPTPQGELELRREIAAHLAIARGIACSPSQIIITAGFAAGLGLALRVLGLEGRRCWFEDPGFPVTRRGVELARLIPVPVAVDENGIDVDDGIRRAGDAALAVVTPGQQAPLGPTLALTRRLRLLDWAAERGAWIIEDDYLGELQLRGRAAPALASLDRAGRVIHIGSFSKTISPSLRLGFIVVPAALAAQFAETAACLAPAPGPSVQLATAEFMRDGHYMRHLRHMKRVYATRRDALTACLERRGHKVQIGGLAALLRLPEGTPDIAIAREASAYGLAPAPLSPWYATLKAARPGLLLGIGTVPEQRLKSACDRLCRIIEQFAAA
ncbi:PLP-dependent aminotransferase family protein [Dongia soli]|uniref:PLP-dependent aminotransferase family protein n=1 Tax=Dongia soli TaxID=600628 RepID=A0ABU5EBA4_9PROT|nr:PLP-dependent aminotransferase family protein [Dongia soli]MDY0883645.1 PLP-dependent aminotransferase family protein [Dongia soli]